MTNKIIKKGLKIIHDLDIYFKLLEKESYVYTCCSVCKFVGVYNSDIKINKNTLTICKECFRKYK